MLTSRHFLFRPVSVLDLEETGWSTYPFEPSPQPLVLYKRTYFFPLYRGLEQLREAVLLAQEEISRGNFDTEGIKQKFLVRKRTQFPEARALCDKLEYCWRVYSGFKKDKSTELEIRGSNYMGWYPHDVEKYKRECKGRNIPMKNFRPNQPAPLALEFSRWGGDILLPLAKWLGVLPEMKSVAQISRTRFDTCTLNLYIDEDGYKPPPEKPHYPFARRGEVRFPLHSVIPGLPFDEDYWGRYIFYFNRKRIIMPKMWWDSNETAQKKLSECTFDEIFPAHYRLRRRETLTYTLFRDDMQIEVENRFDRWYARLLKSLWEEEDGRDPFFCFAEAAG